MDQPPLVTIVTPSLNQGEFLEDTLVSVANQTYPRIEHVVIDGGSTDRTLALLRRYESRYRLRWYSEPDTGQANALNKGFALAHGAFIGWLNADDAYFSSDAIEAIVHAFTANPHASVVYGDCAFISRQGKVFRIAPAMSRVTRTRLQYHSIGQPAVFFTRRIIQDYHLREDLHYLIDCEYWLRLCARETFVHVNKIIAAWRVHSESQSFRCTAQADTERRTVWQEYFKGDRGSQGLFGAVMQRCMAFHFRACGLLRLPEVYQRPLAFPGFRPPRYWLGLQQMFLPVGVYGRRLGTK